MFTSSSSSSLLIRSLCNSNINIIFNSKRHFSLLSSSGRKSLFGNIGGGGGGGGGGKYSEQNIAAYDDYHHSDGGARNLPSNYGVRIVPEKEAWVVERFGKFHRILSSGLHFLIPLVDNISYVHTMKEVALEVADQTAITGDNVSLHIDGVLYFKVEDAYKASYGVVDPIFAIRQLAMTTMRSELGKMTLDKTFHDREQLNANIVSNINIASADWGIKCLRYEIRDILPPKSVLQAMELQVAAERKKRAQILNAQADAESILAKASATSEGLNRVASALQTAGGQQAASLRVAEQYVEAFANLAKESNTMIITPSHDISSMISQAMGIYKNISPFNNNNSKNNYNANNANNNNNNTNNANNVNNEKVQDNNSSNVNSNSSDDDAIADEKKSQGN